MPASFPFFPLPSPAEIMFLTVSTIIIVSGSVVVTAPCFYETVSLWLDIKSISSLSSSLECATVNICTLVALSPLSL